MTLSDCQVTA